MAYIGKTPIVGNFQKCDALTASATADYTLQVSSTNIVPESVNHMIVSLNGVIQSPTTAYTVSGSTLSFASALTSSDTIDFVILLGNVLDVGTVSDNTITLAKMAGGTDGNIISYDTSGNPVAVATGTDGQVLTSSGADAVCAFEDAPSGGLAGMDMWRITADSNTNQQPIENNWEQVDTGGFAGIGTSFSAPSSGIWTFPSTGIWEVTFTFQVNCTDTDVMVNSAIQITPDDSSYTIIAYGICGHEGSGEDWKTTIPTTVIVDVTDTSLVKFKLDIDNLNSTSTMQGATTNNLTYVVMKKLGET